MRNVSTVPGKPSEAAAGLQCVVQAEGLRKAYGSFTAVDGIGFSIFPGECFGFLGPNGAGKTTTMRLIGASGPPSSGTLTVFGMDSVRDARRIKKRLGVVPQEDNLDIELTVLENLLVYARYFGISSHDARSRGEELLEFFQLAEKKHQNVSSLSGGMKRRLLIARGLINEPEILLLDEPTTGLDPQARHLVWDKLRRIKSRTTLILTTHYMDEAEQLCDRLVVMEKGRILDEGAPRSLIQRYVTREVLELHGPIAARVHLREVSGLGESDVEELEDRTLFYVRNAEETLHRLAGAGEENIEFHLRRASLEDVFLKLTGRRLAE